MWGTSRQVYLLCRWERHLAGFPHLGVVDRWPATPKRARIAVFFRIFSLKRSQQALKRKDSNVHCGSIGRRNNGVIGSNNSQCLVNLALMRHSSMAMKFGAGELD